MESVKSRLREYKKDQLFRNTVPVPPLPTKIHSVVERIEGHDEKTKRGLPWGL